MKGQSILLSHAILVGLSVFLVFIIATTMNDLRGDYQNFIAEASIDQLCLLMKTGIERVYQDLEYSSSTDTTYGSVVINFPERLADKRYRIKLNTDKSVSVETNDGSFNTTCNVGLNATYQGFTTGGNTVINFIVRNSTKFIEVTRL